MTWFDDGDGWRDDSTEGPCYDLRVHYASGGRIEIVQYDYKSPCLVRYRGHEIGREKDIDAAKKTAEKWWKENKNDPEAAIGKDAGDEGSYELG